MTTNLVIIRTEGKVKKDGEEGAWQLQSNREKLLGQGGGR